MSETIKLEQANKMMSQMIDYEIEHNYNGQTDIIVCANKCRKHIKCLCCLDTHKILFTSESFFGGTYEEFSCPACSGPKTRLDSHHQIYHCQVNGRQVPYNGGDRNTGYSRVMQLYNIYKGEYEQHDLLIEENEIKKAAAALEAEKKLLEIQRIKAEEEERNKPSWEFMDSQELMAEIGSVDASVDISKLVSDIAQLMAASAGNVVSLTGFLYGLDVTLKYYWANENSKNNSFYRAKDKDGENIYVKFEYQKIKNEKQGGLGIFRFNGSSKKEFLKIIYFIAKPTNGNHAAEKICTDLMNITIQSIVDKLKK